MPSDVPDGDCRRCRYRRRKRAPSLAGGNALSIGSAIGVGSPYRVAVLGPLPSPASPWGNDDGGEGWRPSCSDRYIAAATQYDLQGGKRGMNADPSRVPPLYRFPPCTGSPIQPSQPSRSRLPTPLYRLPPPCTGYPDPATHPLYRLPRSSHPPPCTGSPTRTRRNPAVPARRHPPVPAFPHPCSDRPTEPSLGSDDAVGAVRYLRVPGERSASSCASPGSIRRCRCVYGTPGSRVLLISRS
ncbi:hypothetical protein CoHVHLJ_117 [Columbid alphaherpesvirus 1]|uniref:Uncharacterized protein n=1 Tax=Columbid alphaherpesvirus 1 TaxID=93386 RepID=A0A1V0M8L2_9ALPH|nr:hypothetical protein [Columbid alphaherpesvirus 1]YP_009353011.1 hypothetical protein CoHVHLJ_117 [Columbid alphaherpesvirus 1]ARD71410.1 hypothetical protein [Columbid alphaherpesvirus 1]ARD71428.1 hypothetical protein CoHVHLJ_117 [Columbid alphaherpesvirus 1]